MKYLERFLLEASRDEKNQPSTPPEEPTKPTEELLSVMSVRESGVIAEKPLPPSSPLKPGWTISFYGTSGRVEGGKIKAGRIDFGRWIFTLEDGRELKEREILSVMRIEGGHLLGAWSVREHGIAGEGLFDE